MKSARNSREAANIVAGCNFLVLGKTGVGKSSLLNALLGDVRFKTGTGRPVTEEGIFKSEAVLDGINVSVFDSWGLEVGAVDAWRKILKKAQQEHDVTHRVEEWFHAVVYCVSAGGARVEDVDREIITSLLESGLYVIVALTKADQCTAEDAEVLRKILCSADCCKNLNPSNVIETCVGAETRMGKAKPFGIPELKKAILANYKKTIVSQLPLRCMYLASQEVEAFKKQTERWISSCDWKYDETENNRPLKSKCDAFVHDLFNVRFPTIVQQELAACISHGQSLAMVMEFDSPERLIPPIAKKIDFVEYIGNLFSKTLKFLNPFGPSDTEVEQERLRAYLDKFSDNLLGEIKNQKSAIEKKVKEVLK